MVEDGKVVEELEELKEKRVEDGNALDVVRRKNAKLEHEVLELKGKRVDDENAIDVVKRKNSELESEVVELRKLKEKWEEDRNELNVIVLKLEKFEASMVR
ncbi:hypothetical protein MtrunA17_Chr5g0434161 [Medicago truncatula]|uniref:Uncharacterized protein n=1 Tax=Medicago truncatula TaxID=3880 RepID=A0A396HU51_MEDTR|nr:hypothetical protein MtrunA17_Chr5g0434161 [Medicago truncatula]